MLVCVCVGGGVSHQGPFAVSFQVLQVIPSSTCAPCVWLCICVRLHVRALVHVRVCMFVCAPAPLMHHGRQPRLSRNVVNFSCSCLPNPLVLLLYPCCPAMYFDHTDDVSARVRGTSIRLEGVPHAPKQRAW